MTDEQGVTIQVSHFQTHSVVRACVNMQFLDSNEDGAMLIEWFPVERMRSVSFITFADSSKHEPNSTVTISTFLNTFYKVVLRDGVIQIFDFAENTFRPL